LFAEKSGLILSRKTGRLLKAKGLTLSCAESCSGGLLSHLITSVPGSSSYFKGGIICYSLESKRKILGVGSRLLSCKGAVSKEVCLLLAKNVRRIFSSDIGVSITGVAGPSRDEKNNPPGTVFIGVCLKDKCRLYEFRFRGSRMLIKKKAAIKALGLILSSIK